MQEGRTTSFTAVKGHSRSFELTWPEFPIWTTVSRIVCSCFRGRNEFATRAGPQRDRGFRLVFAIRLVSRGFDDPHNSAGDIRAIARSPAEQGRARFPVCSSLLAIPSPGSHQRHEPFQLSRADSFQRSNASDFNLRLPKPELAEATYDHGTKAFFVDLASADHCNRCPTRGLSDLVFHHIAFTGKGRPEDMRRLRSKKNSSRRRCVFS